MDHLEGSHKIYKWYNLLPVFPAGSSNQQIPERDSNTNSVSAPTPLALHFPERSSQLPQFDAEGEVENSDPTASLPQVVPSDLEFAGSCCTKRQTQKESTSAPQKNATSDSTHSYSKADTLTGSNLEDPEATALADSESDTSEAASATPADTSMTSESPLLKSALTEGNGEKNPSSGTAACTSFVELGLKRKLVEKRRAMVLTLFEEARTYYPSSATTQRFLKEHMDTFPSKQTLQLKIREVRRKLMADAAKEGDKKEENKGDH